MRKTECLAMILAGGQGSRLGALTKKIAKPAVPFGGKYRIIDFPLSNCANSGIDKVGVLTQYRPLELHNYLASGSAWDLDQKDGGIFILPPYARERHNASYSVRWRRIVWSSSNVGRSQLRWHRYQLLADRNCARCYGCRECVEATP